MTDFIMFIMNSLMIFRLFATVSAISVGFGDSQIIIIADEVLHF